MSVGYTTSFGPQLSPSTAKAHLASAPHAHEVAEQDLVCSSHQKQRKRSNLNAHVCRTMDAYHVLP